MNDKTSIAQKSQEKYLAYENELASCKITNRVFFFKFDFTVYTHP